MNNATSMRNKRIYRWDQITAVEFEYMEAVLDSAIRLPDFPIRLLKRIFEYDPRLVIVGKDHGFNSKMFVFFLRDAVSRFLIGRTWNEDNPADKTWRKDLENAYWHYKKTGRSRFDH